jgi:hypothetical protein
LTLLASAEVTEVATWVGLITGVAGTVLAVVAIWFAAVVDRRSRETSSLTIQSSQKIESAVERISTDTGGLIRGAWERMLGTVGAPLNQVSDETANKAIAAGIAAELRAELTVSHPDGNDAPASEAQESDGVHGRSGDNRVAQLDEAIRRMERTLETQLRSREKSRNPVDDGIETLGRLSPTARALVRALANSGHLERAEYQRLRRDPQMNEALSQLRGAGLLVPLRGSNEEVVYWIPASNLPSLGAALLTTPPDPTGVRQTVEAALAGAGHTARVKAFREARDAARGHRP